MPANSNVRKLNQILTHMKPRKFRAILPVTGAILSALLFGACDNRPPATAQKPAGPEAIIEIKGDDQMKFDVTTFRVKPGQPVKVVFRNAGTMPKESMGHCWTLLDRNTNLDKFVEAGFAHASSGYIAPEMKDKVLATSKVLGPGETETVSFIAPTIQGDYTYVCVFPGHSAMMRGVMTVL